MKPSVKGQFWMEGHAEFLAVEHAHDFLSEVAQPNCTPLLSSCAS